jgi:hypothetical protein
MKIAGDWLERRKGNAALCLQYSPQGWRFQEAGSRGTRPYVYIPIVTLSENVASFLTVSSLTSLLPFNFFLRAYLADSGRRILLESCGGRRSVWRYGSNSSNARAELTGIPGKGNAVAKAFTSSAS